MRFVYFILLLIFLSCEIFSQEIIKSNYDIMDSISNDCVKSIVLNISEFKTLKSFYLEIDVFNNNGSNKLFENKIIKSFPDNKILTKKDSTEIILSLRVEDFSVKYERYEPNQDSLYRIIKLSTVSVIDNGKTKKMLNECKYEYKDLVSRDDIDFIERTTHPFAKSPIPERKKTLFESILQPAIYVSAALITVIILFTVRSN